MPGEEIKQKRRVTNQCNMQRPKLMMMKKMMIDDGDGDGDDDDDDGDDDDDDDNDDDDGENDNGLSGLEFSHDTCNLSRRSRAAANGKVSPHRSISRLSTTVLITPDPHKSPVSGNLN